MRTIPASIAVKPANKLTAEDWTPKNVPYVLTGMILAIKLCQAVAVRPPPNPCQISSKKVNIKDNLIPICGENHATTARPKNGIRSLRDIKTAIGLYRLNLETLGAVNNWGSSQPTAWIAGIRPMMIAESVRLLTNRGITVMKEANPRAAPKKPPSNTLTVKLKGRSLLSLDSIIHRYYLVIAFRTLNRKSVL